MNHDGTWCWLVPWTLPQVSASASMDADAIGEGRSSPGEEKEERASGSNIPDEQAKVGYSRQI